MSEFKREERYVVLKLSDVKAAGVSDHTDMVCEMVSQARFRHNKPPLKCVIVESDWPEYEPTWKAIERRMTGQETGAGSILQDFCDGTSSYDDTVTIIATLQAALSAAEQRAEAMRKALEPFAHFADCWERQPIARMHNDIYTIHTGSEFEATLRRSDCFAARAALATGKSAETRVMTTDGKEG